MTIVKKQFEELYTILEENKNKKISSVLPQLIEIMSKKNNASGHANTFLKDDYGNVIAIYCYYHKKWEKLSECDYGVKANTATGYNTMCKEGVSNWTKQQRVKKVEESKLLTKVAAGELKVEDIALEQARILEESKIIIPRQDGLGCDDVSDVDYNN